MIWKMLGATGALFVLATAYITQSVGISSVFNFLNGNYGTTGRNGVTVSAFTANQFALYSAAIVIAVIFLVFYLFAAAGSEEEDQGIISEG